MPFKQQEQILFHVIDRLPRFGKGANDARGNGQQLAESTWQKYGQARVEPVMLSEEWYRSNMPAFQAAFQDGTITVPRDVDVRDDLRAIKLIKGVGRIPDTYKGKGADGKPRHADAAIALVLAYYASQQPAEIFDYTPVPLRAAYRDHDRPGRRHDDRPSLFSRHGVRRGTL